MTIIKLLQDEIESKCAAELRSVVKQTASGHFLQVSPSQSFATAGGFVKMQDIAAELDEDYNSTLTE